MCGKQNRTDSSGIGIVLAEESVTYLFELWAGEFHPQGTAFIKPRQIFPEYITMLHLLWSLMLSISDELAYLGQKKIMLRDVNNAFFLWNKNYQIKTLMLLNNILW